MTKQLPLASGTIDNPYLSASFCNFSLSSLAATTSSKEAFTAEGGSVFSILTCWTMRRPSPHRGQNEEKAPEVPA